MRHIDPDALARLIAEISAETVLPRFRNLQDSDVIDKGNGDLVTRADHDCEDRLTEVLRDLLPGSTVVGEEAAHADASVIDRIGLDDMVWIIDPLDGTNNFAKGNPAFAVMVALMVEGVVRIGAIHLPIEQTTALAALGEGAYLNGTRLCTAPAKPLDAMAASIHLRYLPKRLRDSLGEGTKIFRSNEQIYCAGRVYVALAEGRFDTALFWRTKPWDHAMGALILDEAGGVAAFSDHTPYAPQIRDRYGLVAASHGATWQAVRDHLFGEPEKQS